MELLFKTLETQEYVLPVPKADAEGSATPTAVNPPVLATDEKPAEELVPVVSKAESPTLVAQINGSAPVVKRESRKSESEKEERDKEKRPRSRFVYIVILYSFLSLGKNLSSDPT